MAVALRLPDGTTIHDPEWQCVADVMRGAHGQGITRVSGEVIHACIQRDPACWHCNLPTDEA